MAEYNQTGAWSSQNAVITGTTSLRPLLWFDDDKVVIPSVRGRADANWIASTGQGGTTDQNVASITNPTTMTLWVEEVILHVNVASSSSGSLFAAIANTAFSSGTNLINASTLLSVTSDTFTLRNSSALFPVAWGTTQYLTVSIYSATEGSTAVNGTITAFYVAPVVT